MRKPVRVAVHNAAFCVNVGCPDSHLYSFGASDYVDCGRRDCDNHKRGPGTLAPVPEPPFALPAYEPPKAR